MKIIDVPKNLINMHLRIYKKEFIEIAKTNKIYGKGINDPMVIISRIKPFVERKHRKIIYDIDMFISNSHLTISQGYISFQL